MQFQLTTGGHWDGVRLYSAGDVVESEKDLAAAFPDKFVRVSTPATVSNFADDADDVDATTAPRKVIRKRKEVKPDGADVTADFVDGESEHKIYKCGNRYFVYHAENLSVSLTPDGLKRGELVRFLQQ